MTELGSQSELWLNFYEKAWALRADWMKQIIAQGETHPLRIISKYQSFEKKYNVKEEDGQASFHKIDYKQVQYTQEFDTAPNDLPEFRVSALQDGLCVIPFTFTPGFLDYINSYLEKSEWDAVIELGCGYGQNLFGLYYTGGPKKAHYYGGEYTNSGVTMGKTLAALDKNLKFDFFHFDHLHPDLSFLPRFKNVFIFTLHSLEQINVMTPDFFKILSQAGENVVGLHLEPFGFQFDVASEIDVHQKITNTERQWNINFLETIKKAQELEYITIDYLKKNMFPQFDPGNPTSVAWWTNKKK